MVAPAGLLPALAGQFLRSAPPAPPGVAGFSDGAAASTEIFGAALGALPMGVVILDRTGVIHYVNESAARMLGSERVVLLGRRADGELTGFVMRHLKARDGTGCCISAERILVGGETDPVTAIARSTLPRPDERGLDRRVIERITVLLPASPVAPPMLAALLHSLFNLTPAEQLLATELGTGANLSDVARARGVALGTVRSQLKSVFGKMGVTRQSELVRALMSLQLATSYAEP
jgi:DNA-binding CsgD family transcriptional regulator